MRNLFKILLLTFCGMVAITSCSDDSDGIPGWPWNDNSIEGPEKSGCNRNQATLCLD
ncbi:hypothetical protein NXY21_14965 [Bacteroides thetaiotaomicron]|nr:hypothetical protein [Bacteroides thetaiotaomicron]